MKAITLTQPWATLVALGAKKIETRSWATDYRGPIAIHAAKNLAPIGGAAGLVQFWWREPFRQALETAGYTAELDHELPRGTVVAVADLVGVVPSEDAVRAGLTDDERAFGDFTAGRYAWVLEHVVALPRPIACRGAQGLWSPPAYVIAYCNGARDAGALLR